MSSRTSPQPALPAREQAAPDEPAGSRKRTGLSRETLVVRVLQVSLGVTLLGLGQLIAYNSSVFQMDGVYGILVLLAVIAVVLSQLMAFLERRLLRWQPPADR